MNVCAVRIFSYSDHSPKPHEPEIMTEDMRTQALAAGLKKDQIRKVGDLLSFQFGSRVCRHCGCLYKEK